MSLNGTLILNFIVALFIYNILLKAIANTMLTQIFKNEHIKKEKQSFRDKLKKKLEENDK